MGAQASKEDHDRGALVQQEEIDARTAEHYAIERANIRTAKAKKKAERLASEAAQKKASAPPQKTAKLESTTKSGDSATPIRHKKDISAKTGGAKGVKRVEAAQSVDGSLAKADTSSSSRLKRKSSTPDAGSRREKKPMRTTVLELDSDDDDEVMEVAYSAWEPRKERLRK